jgi:hypothetical protein
MLLLVVQVKRHLLRVSFVILKAQENFRFIREAHGLMWVVKQMLHRLRQAVLGLCLLALLMQLQLFAVAVAVLVKQALVLAVHRLWHLLVAQFLQLVVAHGIRVSICQLLQLLALQTRVAVRHTKQVWAALFTLLQLEAHRTALKLLLAVQ